MANLLSGCDTLVHVDGDICEEIFLITRTYFSKGVKFFVHLDHPAIEMKNVGSKYAAMSSKCGFHHYNFLERGAKSVIPQSRDHTEGINHAFWLVKFLKAGQIP